MRMTMVIIVAVIIVTGMIIVAVIIVVIVIVVVIETSMIVVAVIVVASMAVIIVVIVIVVVIVTSMIVVAVIVVVIVIVVTMSVNHSVEVFRLSVNSRRSDRSFNGKHTVIGQSPFEDVTKLTINGVVLRLAIEVGFHASMPLNGDHWSDPEFTLGHLFTTTMSAMGMDPADCSITGQQQGKPSSGIQKRKTRKGHWIRKSENQKSVQMIQRIEAQRC